MARAAELHDVGKMAVPDEILQKPGPLDRRELDFIRQHTLVGERILAAAPALQPVARLVRASHERWDGSGYPDGLARRGDPAGRADHRGLRRLPRDDLGPGVPAAGRALGGAGRAAALRRHAVRPARRRRCSARRWRPGAAARAPPVLGPADGDRLEPLPSALRDPAVDDRAFEDLARPCVALAASWPQAASMSRPRVRRTVALRPRCSRTSLEERRSGRGSTLVAGDSVGL